MFSMPCFSCVCRDSKVFLAPLDEDGTPEDPGMKKLVLPALVEPFNRASGNGAKEGLEFKNKCIKQCSALSNAVSMTNAVAVACASTEAFKGWSFEEIRNHLRIVKDTELSKNYEILGLEHTSETIPL